MHTQQVKMRKISKRAAMEMSVGTIVTIVLLMSVLVLGIVLVKNIFESSKRAIDMTDSQLQAELSKLFSEEKPVMIYPSGGNLKIKHGESDAIGIGIKNLKEHDSKSSNTFSYKVQVTDASDCGNFDPEEWIKLGKSIEGIELLKGSEFSKKIIFEIPEGSPICTAEFRVDVKCDKNPWKSEFFYIIVK